MYRSELSSMANELWQLGVVEILFNADGSNSVSFGYNNYRRYREVKETLTEEQMHFLEAVAGSSLGNLDFPL